MKDKVYILTRLLLSLTETIHLMICYLLDPGLGGKTTEGFGVLRKMVDKAEKDYLEIDSNTPSQE